MTRRVQNIHTHTVTNTRSRSHTDTQADDAGKKILPRTYQWSISGARCLDTSMAHRESFQICLSFPARGKENKQQKKSLTEPTTALRISRDDYAAKNPTYSRDLFLIPKREPRIQTARGAQRKTRSHRPH